LKKNPEHYILRRYTKYAGQELGFNTHDKLLDGNDGVMQCCRLKRLTSRAMAAARSGVMSEAACQNTLEGSEKIIRENKIFPPDIGPDFPSRHRAKGEQWTKKSNRTGNDHNRLNYMYLRFVTQNHVLICQSFHRICQAVVTVRRLVMKTKGMK